MRIRLLQFIDYWLGIPLCFAASIVHSALRLFVRSGAPGEPKNILLIELSEMGSAVIAYSAIRHLQNKHPEARLYFLIFKKNRESIDLLGVIPRENVLTISDRNLICFVLDSLRFIFQARRMHIDTAIDLELFSRCTALLSLLSGAARRVGFFQAAGEGLYRGNWLTHRVPYNPHRHMALNFLALAVSLEDDSRDIPAVKRDLSSLLLPHPCVVPSADAKRKIEDYLRSRGITGKRLIILNPDPGAALPLRGWPPRYFAEVITTLLQEDQETIIGICGLPRARPLCIELRRGQPPERVLDFCGVTATLDEFVALLHSTSVFITNDSGPAHLASLTQTPTLVIFGPETPRLYAPRAEKVHNFYAEFACSPCLSALNHRRSTCTRSYCLEAIPPQQIIAATKQILTAAA